MILEGLFKWFGGFGRSRALLDREGNVVVTGLQQTFRDDFSGTAGAAPSSTNWVTSIGTGMTCSQNGTGDLVITAGTTANAVTTLTSTTLFSVPFRVWFMALLSQRIVNQTVYFEAVDQSGTMLHQWILDGTSNTQGKPSVTHGGIINTMSAQSILPTNIQGILELALYSDEAQFYSRAVDSSGTRASSYVLSNNVPAADVQYRVRIRVVNGGTAPASSTTITLRSVSAQDITDLPVEITGGQGDTAGAKAIPVIASYGSGVWPVVNQTPTPYSLNSAATTNAVVARAIGATLWNLVAFNSGASTAYVKLYNSVAAPTVGTTVPIVVLSIPAGTTASLPASTCGYRFSSGIALSIQGGAADADATAVAAGQVKVHLNYS